MTGRIINNLIEVRQGDSFNIVLHFRNSQGAKIDLENSKFEMQVRDNDEHVIFSKEGDITISDASVCFALAPEDTNKNIGKYKTDIQWTDKYGHVNTVFPQDVNKIGIFRITPQVTR